MTSAPERILVRAPNWVGDVMMATPALRALRNAHPEAEIVLAGRGLLRGLAGGIPSVDRFLAVNERGAANLFRWIGELRREAFDWAVLLPDSVRSAIAPRVARIPVRVGYARDAARRALLTTALPPPSRDGKRVPISMVERYLRITRAVGCPDAGEAMALDVASEAATSLAKRLEHEKVGPERELLVVTPGAAFGDSKLWPPRHFAAACDRLARDRGLCVVLAPGPGEEAISAEIAETMTATAVHLVDPVTSLTELAALIQRGTALLTNDTGPRHIAVALGTPVVSLLGPTDRRHTDHNLERQRVMTEPVFCAPCHLKTCPTDHRCMVRLEPDRVADAVRELIG